MTKKISRNDLYNCGSGKKYKKCCLDKEASNVTSLDFAWVSLRRTEGRVVDDHLLPYVDKLPEYVIRMAYEGFCEEGVPEAMDEKLLFYNFFIPWLLFNWVPYDDLGVEGFEPDMTISQNYVKKYGSKLSSSEKRFIETMSDTYYSFYSVQDVELNRSLFIKDIMLGTTHTIKEQQGAQQLKRGDIVFSRILTLDEQSIFVGMAPFSIPTNYHTDLIKFRNMLEENDNKLSHILLHDEFAMVLRDYYFKIMRSSFNNKLPTLKNTDGELIQLSKSYFSLTITPEEALNKLLPLTLSEDAEEFLTDATRNKKGIIQRIELPWLKRGNKKHKGWDNTVMGQITIENGRLMLETNSEERKERGKDLLCKYLDNAITFQQTHIENMKRAKKATDKDLAALDFNELPCEVQKQIKKAVKAHWKNWFDEPIPALDNKTPREASRTESGREILEALLLQYERNNENFPNSNPFKANIEYLKKELALN